MIAAGTLIILFDWRVVDPIVTVMIAAYILRQAFSEIGGVIRMLMLGAPPELDINRLIAAMCGVDGVEAVHHVHVWAIDEQQNALEAHVVTKREATTREKPSKRQLKSLASTQFGISHATRALERPGQCEGDDATLAGHLVVEAHEDRLR